MTTSEPPDTDAPDEPPPTEQWKVGVARPGHAELTWEPETPDDPDRG